MKSGLGAISAQPATRSGLSGFGQALRIIAPAAGGLILKKHGPVLLKGAFGREREIINVHKHLSITKLLHLQFYILYSVMSIASVPAFPTIK